MVEELIFCVYLSKMASRLEKPPMPGEMGKVIYENISQDAWDSWLEMQTKLMNEHRFDPMNRKDREKIRSHMMSFLKLNDLS